MSVIKQKLAKKESGIIDRKPGHCSPARVLQTLQTKQGGTLEQEKGAVTAVEDLYDVVQQEGIRILFYLQKIYPDEWKNFLNALDFELFDNPTDILALRFWASYQGQTLARTEGSDVEGAISSNDATDTRAFELSPEAHAHADLTCQIYGKQKEGQKPEAADIVLRPKQQSGKPRLQPSYWPRMMSMILRAL